MPSLLSILRYSDVLQSCVSTRCHLVHAWTRVARARARAGSSGSGAGTGACAWVHACPALVLWSGAWTDTHTLHLSAHTHTHTLWERGGGDLHLPCSVTDPSSSGSGKNRISSPPHFCSAPRPGGDEEAAGGDTEETPWEKNRAKRREFKHGRSVWSIYRLCPGLHHRRRHHRCRRRHLPSWYR